MDFTAKAKELFSGDVIQTVAGAGVGFFGSRLAYKYGTSKITAISGYPEMTDLAVVIAGLFMKGSWRAGMVGGAGLSLVDNLLKRFKVELL